MLGSDSFRHVLSKASMIYFSSFDFANSCFSRSWVVQSGECLTDGLLQNSQCVFLTHRAMEAKRDKEATEAK